jgi:hypothetical protein
MQHEAPIHVSQDDQIVRGRGRRFIDRDFCTPLILQQRDYSIEGGSDLDAPE